jgi:hypothetical protein
MARATRKRPFGAAPKSVEKGRRPRVNIPLFAESLDFRESVVPQPLELRAPVPSISIGLVDWDGTASWRIEVEVSTAAGIRRLGTIITTAPNLAADPTRNRIVAVAYCPGALGWSLQIRPVAFGTTAQPATLSVTGTQCCAGPPGVQAIEPFATPLTPTTEGILIVPTFAAAANVNGGNGLIYVVEGQSFYLWVAGDPTVPDGVFVIAGVAGPLAGNWVHQGQDLYLSPIGGTPAIDDWPRLIPIVNAGATYGKRVLLTDGTWLCKTSAIPLVSNVWLEAMGPGVTILTSLPNVGLPTVAPFWSVLGAQGVITTLAAPVNRGAFSIVTTVDESAIFVPGTILQIANPLTAGNSAGFRVSTHRVAGVAGVNVNVLPDLPRSLPAGSTVSNFATRPTNIRLIGNRATITGTSVRYIELAAALDCFVSQWRFTDESGAIGSDLLLSFDGGGTNNRADDIAVRIQGPSTPLAATALESCDGHCIISRLTVNGATSYGSILYDCSDSDIEESTLCHCGVAGVALVADTAVHSASTEGCIGCTVRSTTALNSAAGLLVRDGARDCWAIDSSFDGNTIGISLMPIGGDASTPTGNTFRDVTARFNATHGVVVGTGAVGTVIDGIDVSSNGTSASTGTGILLQGHAKLGRLYASGGNNANLILASAGGDFDELDATAAPTPAINGWCQLNGGAAVRYTIRASKLILAGGAVNSGLLQVNAMLSIDTTEIAANGGAATSVLAQPTGIVRIGQGNKWDGSATPFGLNGVGGVFSQATTVSGGAGAAQAVAFGDMRTTDDVVVERTVNGGAPGIMPLIVKTAGTGYTLTFAAGDTSTYVSRIV